jgi:hypothetical protein
MVDDLATLFGEPVRPPQILLDVQATETRVRHTPLGQYRYLFFGTHGFLANNLAGVREPTLVLTQVGNKPPDNGFLTFSKVLRLKLDTDLPGDAGRGGAELPMGLPVGERSQRHGVPVEYPGE